MAKQIPPSLIALVADLVAIAETHSTLDSLFMFAEAPGDPPAGSKPAKAQEWLRNTNKKHPAPLSVLGKILAGYLEDPTMAPDYQPPSWETPYDTAGRKRELVRKIEAVLAKNSLRYRVGGFVDEGALAPSRKLAELIRDRDMPAIHQEFERAMETVEAKPREAVSAASNILESVFKIYIQDNGLRMPDKQDLQSVFKVVRGDLRLDPSSIEDKDLQRIITGLLSVVDGIGALRTHAGSAHGGGRKAYRLEPRHARLAVNAGHTVATFVLETWDKRAAARRTS